jgi:phosphatidylserine decarboxylase
MTVKAALGRVLQQERLNFLLTNRIPRRLLTRAMGRFSRVEVPVVRDLSLAAFRFFADDLHLEEARKSRFSSLHDCFVRELRPGARPIDPDPRVLVSPCDGIVGASGRIRRRELIQAKGRPYTLEELLADPAEAGRYEDGCFVTLRLKANMYHRFHAPHDCRVDRVTYVPGDVWNVNPPALRRVPRLYARNERAVLRARLDGSGLPFSLIPVAAILVAGIRLGFLDLSRQEHAAALSCDARLGKGEEMGWFEHGSTIIVLAPPGLRPCAGVREGTLVHMGERLLHLD